MSIKSQVERVVILTNLYLIGATKYCCLVKTSHCGGGALREVNADVLRKSYLCSVIEVAFQNQTQGSNISRMLIVHHDYLHEADNLIVGFPNLWKQHN